MMNNIQVDQRGRGRPSISGGGEQTTYKVRLTVPQRERLDSLGGAAWLRRKIDLEIEMESIDMSKGENLSCRYIRALRQLPQYMAVNEHTGPLTHVMTGVRVLPLGDITDPDDETGLLRVEYPGGNSAEVVAHTFLDIALNEAVQIEINTAPGEFMISPRKMTDVQKRIDGLREHLRGKHSLE